MTLPGADGKSFCWRTRYKSFLQILFAVVGFRPSAIDHVAMDDLLSKLFMSEVPPTAASLQRVDGQFFIGCHTQLNTVA
jgi:hypothetical protein